MDDDLVRPADGTKLVTKFKNDKPIQKWTKLKMANQIEKWDKRSFYQGPGVKFPILWEKITLPP